MPDDLRPPACAAGGGRQARESIGVDPKLRVCYQARSRSPTRGMDACRYDQGSSSRRYQIMKIYQVTRLPCACAARGGVGGSGVRCAAGCGRATLCAASRSCSRRGCAAARGRRGDCGAMLSFRLYSRRLISPRGFQPSRRRRGFNHGWSRLLQAQATLAAGTATFVCSSGCASL